MSAVCDLSCPTLLRGELMQRLVCDWAVTLISMPYCHGRVFSLALPCARLLIGLGLLAMLGLVGIVGVGGWVKKRKTRSSHESILLASSLCRSCLSLSILLPYTSILFRTPFRLLLGFVSRAGGFKFWRVLYKSVVL